MVGEPAGSYVAKYFNRLEVQKAAIPASGGIMSARGLARHYAMLANWGELDGVEAGGEGFEELVGAGFGEGGGGACGEERVAARRNSRDQRGGRSSWS
jgi:hypothetical protein